MLKMLLKVSAVAALGVLSACGSGTGNAPVSKGPVMIVKGSNPTQLFGSVSKLIRVCWLNPRDPVLIKHVFRAEAATDGVTKIVFNELTADGKRGLKAFSIDFKRLADGTQITTQNHRLIYGLSQKLNSDLGYWAQGGASCDGPGSAAISELRGSVSGPVVSR
jgi:hypothetical protein